MEPTQGPYTVFSSPIVAGVVMHMLGVNPTLSNNEIRQILVETSDSGVVNPTKAVAAALAKTTQIT